MKQKFLLVVKCGLSFHIKTLHTTFIKYYKQPMSVIKQTHICYIFVSRLSTLKYLGCGSPLWVLTRICKY